MNKLSAIDESAIALATTFYLKSGDFNGVPLDVFMKRLSLTYSDTKTLLTKLITEKYLSLISSDSELNPHIIRTGFRDTDRQISEIKENNLHHICIYPTTETLSEKVGDLEFRDEPFRRELSLGTPQLEFSFFELQALEFYRNDPRYYYQCNDIGGRICIKDEHYLDDQFAERDKILLKAFGFAYDDNQDRYVTAFIGDLADLSPEHQMAWNAKRVHKQLKIHPDFYGSQILGRWAQHISIFDAVLQEQRIINEMAEAINKPLLFKNSFGRYLEGKPIEFSFLVRPTAQEFQAFIHLLDKFMSDNINKDFFRGDVELETEETRKKDGKIVVTQKGTITLLDEWLRSFYRTTNWEPWDFAIGVFKNIRKMRQTPAHNITENIFDKKYSSEQRGLMKETYEALAILRHALGSHPKCKDKDFDIPDSISEQRIWTM